PAPSRGRDDGGMYSPLPGLRDLLGQVRGQPVEFLRRQRDVGETALAVDLVEGERFLPLGRELDQRHASVLASDLRHELESESAADMFANCLGASDTARLGDGFQDQGKVADRHALVEEET